MNILARRTPGTQSARTAQQRGRPRSWTTLCPLVVMGPGASLAGRVGRPRSRLLIEAQPAGVSLVERIRGRMYWPAGAIPPNAVSLLEKRREPWGVEGQVQPTRRHFLYECVWVMTTRRADNRRTNIDRYRCQRATNGPPADPV